MLSKPRGQTLGTGSKQSRIHHVSNRDPHCKMYVLHPCSHIGTKQAPRFWKPWRNTAPSPACLTCKCDDTGRVDVGGRAHLSRSDGVGTRATQCQYPCGVSHPRGNRCRLVRFPCRRVELSAGSTYRDRGTASEDPGLVAVITTGGYLSVIRVTAHAVSKTKCLKWPCSP